MRRARVIVPAACTDLGPGIDSLGLALALHNTVEMRLRDDPQQTVFVSSVGEDGYPATAEHPAVRAAAALFEAAGHAMPGLDVHCEGSIPPKCGLGDAAAWTVGGLFAANNLLETPMSRDRIAALALALADRPVEVVTALLGGLTLTGVAGDESEPLVYRRVELTRSIQVVLVVPALTGYQARAEKAVPVQVALGDLVFNLGRTALVAETLRSGDLRLLDAAMHDRVRQVRLRALIPGFEAVSQAARREGASAAAISGSGPAVAIFARAGHEKIEMAARGAFREAGVEARTWVLNIDTQGVAINAQR